MLRRIAAALALIAAAAPAAAQGDDPVVLMAQLESRVLAARRVVVEADIEASGAVDARLKGEGELLERNRATLAYAGDFRGRALALAWSADGRLAQLRNGAELLHEPVSREANRTLLLGLLRMGLVQTLARVAGLAPAGIDGATLDAFRPTTYAMGGELDGAMSFGFDLLVADAVAGSVRLWLDPASGLPRRRQVTLRVGGGEMTVVENYRRFLLE